MSDGHPIQRPHSQGGPIEKKIEKNKLLCNCGLNMKSGTCPKCGSDDLAEDRPFRHQGEGIMIAACNQCRYAELYTLDAQEKVVHRRTVLYVYLGIAAFLGIIIALSIYL